AAIVGFSRISYGLLLPSIRADLRGAYSLYGLVSTANFVGYLLGTLALPLLLALWRNRLKLTVAALLLMNATIIASATSFDLIQLSIWRFLVGFFSAIALVLTLSLVLDCIRPQERGRASGIIWMGASLGVTISGLIAPPMLSIGSSIAWRLVWAAMGISGIAVVFGLHRALRPHNARPLASEEQTSHIQQSGREITLLTDLLRPRGFLFATLAYFGYGFGYIIYLTFFVALVVQQGLPSLLVGLIWAAMGTAGAVSGLIWGRAIDRWPTGFTLAITLLLGALGALSVLTQQMLLEAIGAAFFGLSVFLGPPLIITFLLRRAIPGERYPSSYSLLNTLFGIGQVLGPLAGGLIVDRLGLVPGIALTAVALVAAALLALCYGMIQRYQPTSSVEHIA
ncbi:MAG: YbfB/YjiJ family MFS transporter, partial [Chloroflexi bacterium]|nr:YbfB/YjiJ family MFS transporter [Chloroflexota bacterium]